MIANEKTGITCELIGNCSKEPEMRFTPNGNTVCNFDVATYGYRDSKDGKQDTMWIRVTCWGELAEAVNSVSGLKGSKVKVTGLFWARHWESNGKNGIEYKLNAVSVQYGHKEDLDWQNIRAKKASKKEKSEGAESDSEKEGVGLGA